MAYTPITAAEADAESPVDDNLTDKIADNFADHESRLLLLKAFPLEWRVGPDLTSLTKVKSKYKRLDGNRPIAAQTFTAASMTLDYPGVAGTLEIDIRKYRPINHLINSIITLFSANVNSITQIAPALATQSISRVTPQISTQSISLFKAAVNVSSIILLSADATPNLVRYNLASAIDSDWKVGNTVTFASCTTGANNISATIVRMQDDGGNNVVVTNASGVAQTGAAGTCTLRAYSYNFTNPVSAEFVAGESAILASHSAGASDGTKLIYAINSGGNNIVVKDSAGVVQAGVAGTCNVSRWVFTFLSAASATDFVVGESATTASHTTGANNSTLVITAVNSGGNNVVLYNTAGVAQGGVAGTVNTNRWIYALASNPTTYFSVGQTMVAAATTFGGNNGSFLVKEINRLGTNNLVVYNTAGVDQAAAVGGVTHTYFVVTLAADYSAIYSTSSNVEISGCPTAANSGYFDVVEVNNGGLFNIVINNSSAVLQSSPAGRIITESKSLFSTRPKITYPITGETSYNNTTLGKQTTEAVFDVTGGVVSAAEVTANVSLGLDIISLPTGYPKSLTVQVA